MSNEEQQLKQLAEMFEQQSESINDDGFSGLVVHKINRRIWIRKLIFAALSGLMILIALSNDVVTIKSLSFASQVDFQILPLVMLSLISISVVLLLADE